MKKVEKLLVRDFDIIPRSTISQVEALRL
jgi:hypothetical protein